MTDDQKQKATEVMGQFNDHAESLIGQHGDNQSVLIVLKAFNVAGNTLLDAITANP